MSKLISFLIKFFWNLFHHDMFLERKFVNPTFLTLKYFYIMARGNLYYRAKFHCSMSLRHLQQTTIIHKFSTKWRFESLILWCHFTLVLYYKAIHWNWKYTFLDVNYVGRGSFTYVIYTSRLIKPWCWHTYLKPH